MYLVYGPVKAKIVDFMVAKRIHIKPKHSVHCAGKIAKILDRPKTTLGMRIVPFFIGKAVLSSS